MQPHRQQPTRLSCPWDSPGKNTGVGCHFLLQCMKVKSESEVAQLCPTISDPMDCSLPGSSIHGIFQARVSEWGATESSGHLITSVYRGHLEKHWINFSGPIFFKAISLKVTMEICRKIYTFKLYTKPFKKILHVKHKQDAFYTTLHCKVVNLNWNHMICTWEDSVCGNPKGRHTYNHFRKFSAPCRRAFAPAVCFVFKLDRIKLHF